MFAKHHHGLAYWQPIAHLEVRGWGGHGIFTEYPSIHPNQLYAVLH